MYFYEGFAYQVRIYIFYIYVYIVLSHDFSFCTAEDVNKDLETAYYDCSSSPFVVPGLAETVLNSSDIRQCLCTDQENAKVFVLASMLHFVERKLP